MIKHLAIIAAALLASSAFAQTSERQSITDSKPQARAEAKVAAKPQGKVRAPAGDTANTPEGGAIGTDAAAMAGEKRHASRDTRKPNRRKPALGGTPK